MATCRSVRTLIRAVLLTGLALAAVVSGMAAPASPDRASSVATLTNFNADSSEVEIASVLASLRRTGAMDSGEQRSLLRLLDEGSPVYRGRGPREVTRLRAYIMATLSELGPTTDVLPVVMAELAHGQDPLPMAAAARLAGAIGPGASPAVPWLLEVLEPGFHDQEVDLDNYNPRGSLPSPTTVRAEALGALGAVGVTDGGVTTFLRRIVDDAPDGYYGRQPALQQAAARTLAMLDAGVGSVRLARGHQPSFVTAWSPRGARQDSALRDIEFEDQNGDGRRFGDLSGQPLALVFFYTSCHNANKCPVTISQLAFLQRALVEAGLAPRVRLAAVTYDPAFDTAQRLRKYGENRGLRLSDQVLMLRTSKPDLMRLVEALPVQVSFGAGQINGHRLQLFVFDKDGRYVRHYHSVAWDNDSVLADLKRLSREPAALATNSERHAGGRM